MIVMPTGKICVKMRKNTENVFTVLGNSLFFFLTVFCAYLLVFSHHFHISASFLNCSFHTFDRLISDLQALQFFSLPAVQ